MEIVDKRQAILEAAAKRFSTHGYHETKVEQIAEDAGVAKGTVYLYFKDKHHLLFEVARYYMMMHMERVRAAMAPHESAKDKLRAYARYQFEHFPEMTKFNKLNFEHIMKVRTDKAFSQEMQEDHRAFLEMVTETIRYGIDRKELREMEPADGAMIVMGALHAYIHAAMIGTVEPRDMNTADRIIDLVLQGIER